MLVVLGFESVPAFDPARLPGVETGGPENVVRLELDSLARGPASATWPRWVFYKEGIVHVLAQQSDARMLLGGRFSAVNGVARQNLARLFPDGSLDLSWIAHADGAVTAMALEGGDLFVAGSFEHVNGVARRGLAKLDLSRGGAVDPEWDPHPDGPEPASLALGVPPELRWGGRVSCLVVHGDYVYVGGCFSQVGGNALGGLARVERRGAGRSDPRWAPQPRAASGQSGVVWALELWNDTLVAGGAFAEIGGVRQAGWARLGLEETAVVDVSWHPPLPAGATAVRSMTADTASVYAGVAGPTNGWIVRAPLNGATEPGESWSLEPGFRPLELVVTNGYLWAVGVPLAGGGGSVVGKVRAQDGGWAGEEWVNPALMRSASRREAGQPWEQLSEAHCLALQGRDLWVGGNFRQAGDALTLGLAKLDATTGTARRTVLPQVQQPGEALAWTRQPDGRFVVGGDFAMVDHWPRGNLARFHPDGTLDFGWFPAADGAVTALASSPAGVFAAGLFRHAGERARPHLAKFGLWTGDRADEGWAPDLEEGESAPSASERVSASVTALVVIGTNLVVGGLDGSTWQGIVVLDAESGASRPGPFQPADGAVRVHGLVLTADGALIAAGTFASVGGVARPGLARFNVGEGLVLDNEWRPVLDPAVEGWPVALAVDGTNLFAGTDRHQVVKLNAGGGGQRVEGWQQPELADWAGDGQEAGIHGLAVVEDELFAGGLFSTEGDGGSAAAGMPAVVLVQLDKRTGTGRAVWQASGSGWSEAGRSGPAVQMLGVVADNLFVGGRFDRFGEAPRLGMALLARPDPPLLLESTNFVVFLERHAEDGFEVTHFRLGTIQGGALYLADGVTRVGEGEVITVAQGAAGLRFEPDPDSGAAPELSASAVTAGADWGGESASATAPILGGSPLPYFKLGAPAYRVKESDTLRVEVWKIGTGTGSVQYATVDGTALAGDDYLVRSGVLNFTATETVKALPLLRTGNDFRFESDRSFTVGLSHPTGGGGLANPSSATITIVDDDLLGSSDSFAEKRWPVPLVPGADALVQVRLEPAGAAGQWRLAGEVSWRPSGDTAAGLVRGNYLIEFRSIPGYWPVAPRWVPIYGGQTNVWLEPYFAKAGAGRGHLRVNFGPGAVAANADPALEGAWRVPGEAAWRRSGETVSNLVEGGYPLEFRPVAGHVVPVPSEAIVVAGQTIEVTRYYSLAPPSDGLEPRALTYEEVISTNWPYMFNGQIQTEFGWGSGVVVKERVVLTAAHVLFDDVQLRYAADVRWFHQRHRGHYEPPPQSPRGAYVFEGYAGQRAAAQQPGIGGVESWPLDVSAMFFSDGSGPNSEAGRSGCSGFISMDPEVESQFFGETHEVFLVGHPVNPTEVRDIGKLHASVPAHHLFTKFAEQVYASRGIKTQAGNSGGGLYARHLDGSFYPIGICLGGSWELVIRLIDRNVVDLIERANSTANLGYDASGAGVVQVTGSSLSARRGTGRVIIVLKPTSAVVAGAGWRSPDRGVYGFVSDPALELAGPSGQSFRIEFRKLDGYLLPTNDVVEVVSDQTAVIEAFYPVKPPVLAYEPGVGLRLRGTAGTTYGVEEAGGLEAGLGWSERGRVTLTNGEAVMRLEGAQGDRSRFYRAVWVP